MPICPGGSLTSLKGVGRGAPYPTALAQTLVARLPISKVTKNYTYFWADKVDLCQITAIANKMLSNVIIKQVNKLVQYKILSKMLFRVKLELITTT